MRRYTNIVFTTREDAINVLRSLRDIIMRYGYTTVADFYDMADEVYDHTHAQTGWRHLSNAYTTPVPGGYILVLPDPVELEPKRVKSRPSYVSYRKYYENDVEATNRVYRYNMAKTLPHVPTITNVIFNDPATIVFWADGTKTVVKCQEDYAFDPMTGLSMAICEKAFGSKAASHKVFNKWLPKEDKDEPILYPEFKLENVMLTKALENAKSEFSKFCDQLVAKKRGREEV